MLLLPRRAWLFLLVLLLVRPSLALAQNGSEYKMKCSAAYTGPLDPGQKPEITEVPSSTCYEWVAPYLTPKFQQFYPPTAYGLGIINTWTESIVVTIFFAIPLNDPKRISPDVTTAITKNGKWKDMREVALQSRVALLQSAQSMMDVCARTPRCEIFKMQPAYFTKTIQGEQ